MKNVIKKSVIGSAVILGSIGVAQAATVTPGVGQYTFSGATTLSAPFVQNLSCTLSLTGDVQKDGNGGVIVTVTDGSARGGFFGACGLVGFEFPWTANVAAAQIPSDPTQAVAIMFDNVQVSAAGTSCTNGQPVSIPAMFTNGDPITDPSSFSFNTSVGSCAVMGTIEAETDVNVTQ